MGLRDNRRDFLKFGAALGMAPLAAPARAEERDANFVLGPLPIVSLPVMGGGRFAVRRIYCAGRNYPETVADVNLPPPMGNPDFFAKHRDAVVQNGVTISYPTLTKRFDHEIELVLAMKSGGQNIPKEEALNHVYGYCAGLDMTRRDIFNAAKMKNLPWEIGKSFDQAAPCGAIHPVALVGHVASGRISLTVNGQTRQDGRLETMLWKVPDIISLLSREVGIEQGDLIFTGTPGGVGPVVSGDRIVGSIDGLTDIAVTVA
jgi:fumarylpyruvate hydrolase